MREDFDDEQPQRRALVITAATPCKDDPELFFPRSDTPAAHETAKQLCQPCPHRTRCLTWALDNDEEHGVWGGTSPHDRQLLQRQEATA